MLILTEIAQAQDWHKITPLRSTRTDVEHLLGKEYGRRSPILYSQEKFNVSVTYADGLPCDRNKMYRWKVPHDTVLNFTVYFKPGFNPKLSEFKFDLSKFRKSGDHLPGTYYYESEEQGILIQFADEWVENITYRAPKKDWKLMCNPPAAPNKRFQRTGTSVTLTATCQ